MQIFKNKSSQKRYEKMFELATKINTLREEGVVSLADVNQISVSNPTNGRRIIKDDTIDFVWDDRVTEVEASRFHWFMDKYKRYADEVEDPEAYLFDSNRSYRNFLKCKKIAEKVNAILLDGKIILNEEGVEIKSRFTYKDNRGNLVIELDSIVHIGWVWDDISDLTHVSNEEVKEFIETVKKYKVAVKYERIDI